MISLKERVFALAKRRRARLLLPEAEDTRVLSAARAMQDGGMCQVQLVGASAAIRAAADAESIPLTGFEILDPKASSDREELARQYHERRPKTSVDEAVQLLLEPVFYAGMRLRTDRADALVAGAVLPTARVIEAGLFCVGLAPGIRTASSFFAMEFPEGHPRAGTVVIFADCAVVIEPTEQQLADIAIASAGSASGVLQATPRVALLSFSTRGSARHASVDKINAALALIREREPDLDVDGEFQVDAALSPAVASRKVGEASAVAGQANVLIFPDINAGNIAYKLTQYLGGANAYGPVLQGFSRPVSDLSRGASRDDIIMTSAITMSMADLRAETG
ncbi:MAG: phosphate acyltransferase [Pseudomonadota bacterium]